MQSRRAIAAITAAALAAACAPHAARLHALSDETTTAPGDVRGSGPEGRETLEVIESAPLETSLDHLEIANTYESWLAMIDGAQSSVELSHFYASDAAGSRLSGVVAALERAAGRGVRVRFLADALFAKKYPATLARLGAHRGVEVRTISFGTGVQHAKYFVVDGREIYAGSANFDWRALTHIHEIGARVRSTRLACELLSVFERDWSRAAPPKAGAQASAATASMHTRSCAAPSTKSPELELVVSPSADAAPASDELATLVALIEAARSRIRIQVLSYRDHARDGSPFPTLDEALRRAAARDVRVELVVSDWSLKKPKDAEALRSLAESRNVFVRVITIPTFSGGPIPFARVAHAKYMTVDGALAWIGSSNWEGDYFTKSRNVGVVARRREVASALDRVFADVWSSPHTRGLEVELATRR